MSTIGTTAGDGAVVHRRRGGAVGRQSGFARYLPVLFILFLLIPLQIYIGSIRLSVYRILLLIVIVPCLFSWLSGKVGRVRAPDLLILAHTVWVSISLIYNHGLSQVIQPVGIHFVEVMGSYLVARCYIRSAESFQTAIRTLFYCIIFLLPFAFIESVTGKNLLMTFFGHLGTVQRHYDIAGRMGMARANVVFEHPILYGVFCAGAVALTYYVVSYGSKMVGRAVRTAAVAIAALFSLSSGPLIALTIQVLISGWDHLTRPIKHRWWILGGLVAIMYESIDALSNRTPFHVLVTYLSFNTGSAYNRILIWEFGTADVARHPIFGIGMNDWTHPSWMSDSMDNFWLVLAVHGGLPSFLLFASAVLTMCIAIARVKGLDSRLTAYRRGWMIAVVGLAIAAGTVDLWNAVFCLYFFLIGSMAWLLDERGGGHASSKKGAARRTAPAVKRRLPPAPTFG